MSFWNTIRKIEKIRFYVTLFIVGVLFVVLSVIVLSSPKPELLSAEGIIERIESYTDAEGDVEAQVYISYTDNANVRHENIAYPSYDSSMQEGNTVTVLYDPASPEEIQSPDGEFIPYILLAVGILAIAASVIIVLKGRKKVESNSPFENSTKAVDPKLAAQVREDNAPKENYYFHWTGKMNQSYVLETPAREAVYEAICDHIGVLTTYRYTFVDRTTGRSQEHDISHTVTTRYGEHTGSVSLSTVASSRFKIDDVDNWEYLGQLGYSVEPKRSGIKLNFDVLHHGVPVAFLEAAGVNILKDGAQSALGDKLPGTGLYKVSCRASDLEAVFFACFCVSRVEFY